MSAGRSSKLGFRGQHLWKTVIIVTNHIAYVKFKTAVFYINLIIFVLCLTLTYMYLCLNR